MPDEPTKTVLIVDNDKSVRETMCRIVERMGYRATAVERATRAASIIMSSTVDAILLDLHMPGPHGEDLLAHLKRKNVPIPPTIIVSGYLHQERVRPLLKFGVSGILAKPFEAKRLMDELRRVLEGDSRSRCVFCPQCGTRSAVDDKFCRGCGFCLERELVCRHCGTKHDLGDRFCGTCGARVSEEQS